MKLIKRPCAHCKQPGGIYHIDDLSSCRYCGKTQPRTRPPAPKPVCHPLFVREAKKRRDKRWRRVQPRLV